MPKFKCNFKNVAAEMSEAQIQHDFIDTQRAKGTV